MPRTAGVYSLPAGNPVVTLTTIQSSWANTTMADIATALTGSVPTDGSAPMTGALRLSAGLVGAPALTWSAETTTGLYRAAANDIRFSVAGVDVVKFGSGGFGLANGSAANPSLNFINSPTTGFYRAASDQIGVSIAGNLVAQFIPVTSGGRLVIASSQLHSSSTPQLGVTTSGAGGFAFLELAASGQTLGTTSLGLFQNSTGQGFLYNRATQNLQFGIGSTTYMTLGSTGGITLVNTPTLTPVLDAAASSSSGYSTFSGNLSMGASGGDYPYIGYNIVTSTSAGVYNTKVADFSSRIRFPNGGLTFETAPSVAAAAAITFTVRGTVSQTGVWTLNAANSGDTLVVNTVAGSANGLQIRSPSATDAPLLLMTRNGTVDAYLGSSGGASGIISGSVAGDLCLRAETGSLLMSVSGSTQILKVNGSTLSITWSGTRASAGFDFSIQNLSATATALSRLFVTNDAGRGLNFYTTSSARATAAITNGPTTESVGIYTATPIPLSLGYNATEIVTFIGTSLTGAQTPTLGTNKPGAAAGAPGRWLPVQINGTAYWIPCWL